RVDLARADVEARVVAVRLQQVPADGRRQHAQVRDLDAGGVQAGDHRALQHPRGGGRLAAGDDPRAALQRRPQRGGEPHRDLRGQIDVDEARDAVLVEEARGGPRLPDQALVDVRAGLDLLVRV